MRLYGLASREGAGGFYLYNEGQERILCRACGWNQMKVTGVLRADPVEGGDYIPIPDPVFVFMAMIADGELAEEMAATFSNIALGPVHCRKMLRGRGTRNEDLRHVYVKACFALALDQLPAEKHIHCPVCGRTTYPIQEAREEGVSLPVVCSEDVGLARVCSMYPTLLATDAFREFLESRDAGKYLIWRPFGHCVP